MDLFRAMRVFRRVVELKGFAAAARDLRLSNAAVSKQVAALEERLRTKLLNRTTRSLSLTASGAAYYERCARIVDDVDETERALSRSAAAPTGTLRVNAPMAFGLVHIAPHLPALLQRWPELRLDISYTDRFVDLVEEGVDVVIRIASELPDSATLIAQRLVRARMVVVASPAYLRKHGTPKTPAELARHDCVLYSLSRNPGEYTFTDGDGAALRVDVSGRLSTNNSLAVRDAVLAGIGPTLIPSFYVEQQIRAGKLKQLLSEWEPPPLWIHAVYPRSRHLSPKVRVFVELLRERFSAASWAVKGS